MSNTNALSSFWTYICECLRLLYWTYFKPYTFKYWLQDIHPDLRPRNNPFLKKAEFDNNPRLHRYAGQVWWLNIIIPIIVTLLFISFNFLTKNQLIYKLNWFSFSLFLLCFLSGLILARENNEIRWIILYFLIIISIITLKLNPDNRISLSIMIFNGLAQGLSGGFSYPLAVNLSLASIWSIVYILPQSYTTGEPSLNIGLFIGILLGFNYRVLFINYNLALELLLAIAISFIIGLLVNFVFAIGIGLGYVISILRVYFWLIEIWWIFIQFLTSYFNPQGMNVYLRFTPPFFDELIILPLPFLDEMIFETYKSHPQIAKNTLDYLIAYTNQQKLASRVIIDINADTFIRCQKVSDIVAITNQPIRRISQTPKGLDNVLLPFLEISQAVKAADEATSPYRKSELLNIPIGDLQALKQNLAFNKNTRFTTQFSKVVERWLNILETGQRTLKEQAENSQEIPQVYIAGSSLDPDTAKNRFKGRIDIFREIENLTLSQQRPVLLLFGGRRTGKTSALKYLPHRIVPNIIPLLVDLQGAAAATTLRGLAENIAKQIIEAGQRLPRKLSLPNPDDEELKRDPFPALQTWFTDIERQNPDKRFLLCLDEFERLSEVVESTNSRAPLNFIRNILQHQEKWILLFSGSHQLSELPDYWSDYLINTRALEMTYLQESEARELILKPVEEFPPIYEDAAVDGIIQLTHCQPFLVQLMCYELVQLINNDIVEKKREPKTAKVTSQDVEFIIDTVVERGDQYFRELWTSLQNHDRDFLRGLIAGETPTQQDKGVMRKLTRKKIITSEGNAFQVPLVKRFLEQLLEEE